MTLLSSLVAWKRALTARRGDLPDSGTQQNALGHQLSNRPSRTTAVPLLQKCPLPPSCQLLFKASVLPPLCRLSRRPPHVPTATPPTTRWLTFSAAPCIPWAWPSHGPGICGLYPCRLLNSCRFSRSLSIDLPLLQIDFDSFPS